MDSEFRFFPVMKDETFGYVLYRVDLATNKVTAAAIRREVRDIVASSRSMKPFFLWAPPFGQAPRKHPDRLPRG